MKKGKTKTTEIWGKSAKSVRNKMKSKDIVIDKVKVWKRNPEKVQVPIKHGMYAYDYLTENELKLVSLTEPKRLKKKVRV